MPNFVTNSMTVKGCTNEQIERIVAAAEREELLSEFYPEPDWRQIPNEDGVHPGPCYQRTYRPANRPTWTGVDCSRFPDGTADQRWYDWRVAHWNTKWDVTEVTTNVEDGVVYIYFNTAWAPPSDGWFAQMSEALPNAFISCTFSEPGCDFYGITEASEGLASTRDGVLSDVRTEWIQRTLSAEELAIYENEDHDEYDDMYESVLERWFEVEADELDKALASL